MDKKYPLTPSYPGQTNRKMEYQHVKPSHEQPSAQGNPSTQVKPSPPAAINSAIVNVPTTSTKIHGFLTRPINPLPLFFLFILIKILALELHNSTKSTVSINNLRKFISQAVYNPETINMLMAVSPYLDVPEQEGIYTIVGVLEALQILKGLREGSYQAQRMQQIPVLRLENENKTLGIIKTLKDYLPETTRPTIDRAIQLHESIEKLSNNLKIYRNNLKIAGKRNPNPIEDLGEIIKVIKPIIPEEQQRRLEKFQKLIQVAQIMDLDEMLKNREVNISEKEVDKNLPKKHREIEKNSITPSTTDQLKDKSKYHEHEKAGSNDAYQTASTDEQTQLLEMLLRLMQLFKQTSSTENEQ
ncbi:hypothetical protein JOD02_001004 [Caldicoprobacter guelmensis]|uniref:hypothetical protein n=1 Tax=Caldicoprobacter guelmensis TaxID=1170224 RepID=UPI00195612F3|nr:hypothetical protein [Caldicoprobacter guelmensis]MBM7582147.1 hypothetical protein [Caldicoprobacter guelmensis]